MNIPGAVFYPFKGPNAVRALVIPTAITLAASLAMILVLALTCLPVFMSLSGQFAQNPESMENLDPALLAPIIPGILGGFAVMLVGMMPVYGYYWELIDTWQTNGMDSQAPAWQGKWKYYLKTGFQCFLAGVVLFIPLVVATIPLGALVPFVMAPFFLAAREKTCGAVLREFVPGISVTVNRLVPVLVAFYLCVVVLNLVYNLVGSLISWTIVGVPALGTALAITTMYLMCEQYDIHTPQSVPGHPKPSPHPDPAATSPEPQASPSANENPDHLQNPNSFESMANQLENIDAASNSASAQENISLEQTAMFGSEEETGQPETADSEKPKSANTYVMQSGDNPWLRHRQ